MVEQAINIFVLIVEVIGLIICMFRYVDKPRRSWIYVTLFLLGNLLSDYYWCAYCLLMGEDPDVSSFLAYLGVNLSFIPMVMLLLHMRSEGEKRFFSPLALLPVPLTVWQFTIYIQFGGIFNNIWQCFFTTVIAVLALNSIIYHVKNKKNGAHKPYVAYVMLMFVFFEYAMWTSTCYDWPSELLDPYYYCYVLSYSAMILLPVALVRTYDEKFFRKKTTSSKNLGKIFKPVYIILVTFCCVGGYMFSVWVKGVINDSVFSDDLMSSYRIIYMVLINTATILVIVTIAIVVIVYLMKKASESDIFREEKQVAERSNEAKSEFLASMSHEIRTPINAVLGMNEMILRQSLKARDRLPEDPEAVRDIFMEISNYAGNIDSAGNNLLSIINDILDFSKIEAGKMEIVNAEYKLSEVLNDVSNMIFFRAKNKGLSFVADVDESTPEMLIGDGVHVRQVITNILNNAVKYTDEGTVELRVHGEKKLDKMSGYWVDLIVEVKDTGIGIRKEDIDKLFSKFERVDLEHNKTVEGTGLGLAIARNLLEMMGGDISVDSVYGQGSTFTLHIPQEVVSDEKVGNFHEKFEQRMMETKAYEGSFTANTARVLVVDDTEMNLTVFTSLLRETGIQIDTANSGVEGVRLAAENRYDVIYLDQRMPQMDGSEALRRIRENTSGPNQDTPVICLTADAIVGARERYIAEGFTDYLTKPIDSKELERMLINYIPDEKISYEKEDDVSGTAAGWGGEPGSDAVISGMTEDVKTETVSQDKYAALRKVGVNPDEGLELLGGDDELYREILQSFLDDEINKSGDQQKFFMARDWKNYEILVHALKNTAKMIGAAELSDMAFTLEQAAVTEDAEKINSLHDSMMYSYSKVAEAIKDTLV